jgi:subtilase family serine protease
MKKPSVKTYMKSFAALVLLATLPVLAQTTAQTSAKLQSRIIARIENGSRTALIGSHPPKADPASDIGAVSPALHLQGMSLIFSLTPAQQQALSNLITAQQTPSSPLYHQWLTPETYAAQFGVTDADIAAASGWLQSQGFSVDSVSRSRNRILFSGTAAQVETAFGAPLHNFRNAGETESHYAPATDLTIPSALASSVLAIGNLSSFGPHSRMKKNAPILDSAVATPNFTSGQSGSNFIGPGDINIIYDVNAAYNAGWTGAGQTIVIIGQSAVVANDILSFQTASGITPAPKTPAYTLVPGTGSSIYKTGDEGESDLDIEYSSTIGKGAQVNFIYTGSNTNYGVFDALNYAVTNKIGNIISSSYGICEPALGFSNYQTLDAILAQAAAQGQTVLSAAGDQGSTDCYGEYTTGSASNYQIAVDYPASSAYVTAMGGSEFPVAYTGVGNTTYFTTNGTSDVVTSAKSYIPEQVWNDDVAAYNVDVQYGYTFSPASGGGGISIFTTRPTWQTGTIGGIAIPAGTYRLLPDISLDASNTSAPLLYCSSDTTSTGITGSCSHGFRDVNNQYLTSAGGTSFDGPIFAGMLALINQATGNSLEGVINKTLYTLAANSTTYAKAFHDIALVSNECLAPAAVCGTGVEVTDYPATTGYDQASGLGSIDLYNLMTAWPGYGTVTVAPSISASSTSTLSLQPGTNATTTITVTPAGGFTGAVTFTVTASPNLPNACYSLPGTTVSGTSAAASTLTIETNVTTCGSGYTTLVKTGGVIKASNSVPTPSHHAPLPAIMAGLLFAGLCLKRRNLRNLSRTSLSVALLALLSLGAFGLSGCSSSAPTSTQGGGTNSTTAGTYTITVTATSTATSTITSTTTFSLTVI